MLIKHLDHLFQTALGRIVNQVIGQDHGKGFITQRRPGTEYGMAQTQGLCLADINAGDIIR